jgi:hypothetical protein
MGFTHDLVFWTGHSVSENGFVSVLRWKMHNKAQNFSEILLCDYQKSVSYTKHNFHNPEYGEPKINDNLHEVSYFLNRKYNVFPFTDKMFYASWLEFHCYCLLAIPLNIWFCHYSTSSELWRRIRIFFIDIRLISCYKILKPSYAWISVTLLWNK